MLAGVSASYYTRLEQGQALHASRQVIDALSRALWLTEDERAHLHTLATQDGRRQQPVHAPAEAPDEGVLELLETFGTTPVLVFGRRRDILAWNAAGHALYAGHLDPADVEDPAVRPNATELVFLDAHTRELYVDWEDKALASVGHLRLLAAQYRDDARLHALIGRLATESPEFAAMWSENRIRPSAAANYRIRHPLVGDLRVTQRLLATSEAPDQTLVVSTAPNDSSSHLALSLLTRLIQ